MGTSSLTETFYQAREDYLETKLMSWENLQTLRQRDIGCMLTASAHRH